MSWRDRYRDASFRGVAFFVASHEHAFGRRQQLHEYPLRVKPWAEDLGRKARGYSVTAQILGENYDTDRDALIKAVETEGPGTLVHPYLGTVTVVCTSGSVSETSEEGGMAIFSLEFVEAGELETPAAAADTASAATESAEALDVASASVFEDTFLVDGRPQFVADGALDVLGQGIDAISAAGSLLTGQGSALYDLVQKGQVLRTQALELIRSPAALAAQVIDMARSVRQLASTPAAAFAALSTLLGFGSTLAAVVLGTPARTQQQVNQAALAAVIERAVAAELVRATAEIAFASYQDAVIHRDAFGDQLDALELSAGDAGEDGSYEALRAMRLAMVRDVTARGATLARILTLVPQAVQPALVIAHRIYADASRADEIVARNKVRHPLFVPAGVPLEILSPEAADV
jgi:prophage DNA circulation protein